MVQIDRVHQTPPQHHRPQAIGDVLVECVVRALGRQFRELRPAAVFGNGADVLRGFDFVFFALFEDGFGDFRFARQTRKRFAFIAGEDRLELDRRAFCGLGDEGGLFGIRLKQGTAAHKRQQPVILGLLVIGNQRMVVAFGALDVPAEKHSRRVASHKVDREIFPVQVKPHRGAVVRIHAIGGENLAGQLIVGLVLFHRREQVGIPI